MANNKKFVVKNGLQTKNIDFVTPNEANTLALATQDTGTIAISGNSGHLLSISDNLQNTVYLTGRIVTTSLVDGRDVSVDGSKLDTIGAGSNVSTVAGATGNVSNTQLASGISSSGILTTANVSELTNLYYTNARAYANIVAAGFYDTVSNTAPIGATESGTTLTLSHLNSGVAASTYGGTSTVPVLTVNATGHITSASNATVTVANSNITGNIIASQLQPTEVTASTYGGAAVQPVITVDQQGRITSASNVTSTVANSNITGNIISSQIQPTGVTASTYGGAAVQTVIAVDQQGRITSASNVTSTVANTNITGNIISSQITSVNSSQITGDIALGTQTSGAYVANLVAGTGVTLTGLGDEGTTPTIAIGQAVGTNNNVTFANLTVTGNLVVQGNAVIFESNTLAILDPLIQVGKTPVGDTVDLGFFGHYIGGSPSIERHAGLFRDATDGQFRLFTNLDPEPSTIIDTANATYQNANLVVNFVVGKVTDISNHTTASLSEGSNLYYTNARAYANIVAAGFYDTVSNTAPIGASESGTTLTLSHLNSGVAASTYGGTSTVPVFTVNATGHITSASNATVTVANSNITGNILASQLQPTGVTASTYGGAAVQTVIAVDQQGRITSASNVTSTVANSNITGNIIASQIQPTGVTAGTYGGVATVPVYTVDDQGRLTTASNATISIPSSAINTDVALGTQTSGAYVANLVQGTGIALTGLNNEGATPTIALATSGVAAATYGNATIIPVLTVDTYGRITSASNVVTSVANSNIVGNIISSQIQPTGVTASTYGGAAVQTVITVDQQGRITSASNVTSTVANTNITGNIIASQITSIASSQITGDIALGTQTSGDYVANVVVGAGLTGGTAAGEGINPSIALATSGVAASTYGGAAVQPVFTVDQYGRITSASNVTSTVANSNITGNIIASQIQPTAVTAGTYGGVATVPVYTVDQQGRLTAASNATISIPSSAINTDVALGTQTSGNYVANVVVGAGLTGGTAAGEGINPSIALPTTGVSATTYGNATIVPVITIDAYGRITSASNVTIAAAGGGGSVTSVAGATGAVSNAQLAAGIANTTVSNLTITGNVSLGTNSPSANVHVANGAVSSAFFLSPVTIDNDYNIPTNYNAMTAGPVTIASSANVTIPDGSTWTVV